MGARRTNTGCSSSPDCTRTAMGADIAMWNATYVLPVAGLTGRPRHAATTSAGFAAVSRDNGGFYDTGVRRQTGFSARLASDFNDAERGTCCDTSVDGTRGIRTGFSADSASELNVAKRGACCDTGVGKAGFPAVSRDNGGFWDTGVGCLGGRPRGPEPDDPAGPVGSISGCTALLRHGHPGRRRRRRRKRRIPAERDAY